MGYKLYSNIACLNPTKRDTENITKKCTQRKTHTLKAGVLNYQIIKYCKIVFEI